MACKDRNGHVFRRVGAAACAVGLAFTAAACPSGESETGDLLVPGQIDEAVTEGGPNPASKVVQVTNRGNCPLSLTASTATSDGKPWLSVTPAATTIDPGASAPLTVALEVVTTALLPGNYVGDVRLTGTCTTNGQPARGSPKGIAVNLHVATAVAAISVDNPNVRVDVGNVADQWMTMADNTVHANSARTRHTAVWTGREMWVFGGLKTGDVPGGVGGKYDPLADQWSPMKTVDSPGQRYLHTAVWTGTEMIIWGGRTAFAAGSEVNTGARLGAAWTATTTTSAPTARAEHTAVWTGTEMIVFGGEDPAGTPLATGARYNPTTETWAALPTTNAPSARTRHSAVWTGREMLVWGGDDDAGPIGSGARYSPATNTWITMHNAGPAFSLMLSAWTGSQWILFGGRSSLTTTLGTLSGAAYSPTDDAWVDLADNRNRRSDDSAAAWTGREFILWGYGGGNSLARLDPAGNAWVTGTATGYPVNNLGASAVWTGSWLIVYGGEDSAAAPGVYLNSGAIYR